ncbi:MAG TPA: FtsX-like permease family protein [Cyclobacteriaceae bacterium]|nr:FtsX-like permease family protein [Cyclobacteriaceae bacterium]
MFKNYFKTGFRALMRNELSSLINIGGLGLAVGCCLVVFEFIDWATHLDSFHSKIDKIFVVERVVEKDGETQYYGNSPVPLGPMLNTDFAQVNNVARLNYKDILIKKDNDVFRENITFADDAFYKIFDFPVQWGDPKQFTDHDGIVLTHELSEKLFGNKNSIAKTVSIQFNIGGKNQIENFTVKGVLAKRPAESSFYFSALIPFSKMTSLRIDTTANWNQFADITFIEVDNDAAVSAINEQSKKYVDLYNASNPDDQISAFNFQPLKTMNFHAYKVARQYFNSMKPTGLIMLTVIAIAILVLVYFNYMNIAIASASNRLKEISFRKVMGSSRRQIIVQFISENIILCIAGVIVGLFLASAFFLPWFSSIANVELGKNIFSSPRTWFALVALILISAVSGAVYPAVYISSFNPVAIMKGKKQTGSNNRFRKTLLSTQFFLTFIAISTAIAFIQETRQIKAKPWGYDPSNNIVVTLDKSSNYGVFETALKSNSKFKSVTGSVQSLGNYTSEISVRKIDDSERIETVKNISVLPGFMSQLGIKIINGRDFNASSTNDLAESVIVNHAFIKQMHWSSGVGKSIICNSRNYLIVGEVNDFHYENFEHAVAPIVIMCCKPEEVNFVYVKTQAGIFSSAQAEVKKTWQKINPDLPFDFHNQESVFDGYFIGFAQIAEVLAGSSLIMTLISVSGIFGLALIILNKKMKEISIRKVIGAGIGSIIYLINQEFFLAIGSAILVGIPVSFWLTGILFNQISSESVVSYLPLVLSLVILILTTVISISWHIYKAHTASPTEYLKDE